MRVRADPIKPVDQQAECPYRLISEHQPSGTTWVRSFRKPRVVALLDAKASWGKALDRVFNIVVVEIGTWRD
jgi:hypothetical protein